MSEAVDKAVEFLEREIDKSMAIEHAMANGRRYWLRSSETGYIILSEVFMDSNTMKREGGPYDGTKVASAMRATVPMRRSVIFEMLGKSDDFGEKWPFTTFAESKIAGREIAICNAFGADDYVSNEHPEAFWLMIANEDDRTKVEAFPVEIDKLLTAMETGKSFFDAALSNSRAALTAICSLESELRAVFEKDELGDATGAGRRGSRRTQSI